MFLCVLYYIVNFEIKPWTNSLLFSSIIRYHTAALPSKRIVNKHL